MADYIVLLPIRDASRAEVHLQAHIAFLDGLRTEGRVVANGRFVDGGGGLVIYRGESLEQIRELVERDPFVVHGVRSYEIREWQAKWGETVLQSDAVTTDAVDAEPAVQTASTSAEADPASGRVSEAQESEVRTIGEISAAALKERLQRGDRPIIVDVREDEEVAGGIIPGSIHIRLGDLETRLHDIPQAEELLLVCRGGRRSLIAAELLQERGYVGLVNVSDGITAWQEIG